jgi:hypothetical protein
MSNEIIKCGKVIGLMVLVQIACFGIGYFGGTKISNVLYDEN